MYSLNQTWIRIYSYLFRKYFPEHAKKLIFHDKLEFPEKLSRFEEIQLEELRKWMYKKQIKHINEKFKKNRKVDESKRVSEITLDRFL